MAKQATEASSNIKTPVVPRNAPYAPLTFNNPNVNDGTPAEPVLTMKVADKGRMIVAPSKVDVKSDNASEMNSQR